LRSLNPRRRLLNNWAVYVCLAFLVAFLLATVFRSNLHAADVAVNSWMPTIQSGAFTVFAAGIDTYFDTNYLVLYAVVIAAAFFVGHQKQKGLFVVGALAGAALFVSIVKRIVLVPRPSNALLLKPGYSFPSGHVAGIIVLAGILAFFAWRYWQSKPVRVGIACGYCGIVGLIFFDRVYLNTHWFSDAFASMLLGAAWLVFLVLLYRWLEGKGSFQGRRFNMVANWLYVGAAVLAVLVVLSGAVV
jgi:membrane-associated phospholipid phosphatase